MSPHNSTSSWELPWQFPKPACTVPGHQLQSAKNLQAPLESVSLRDLCKNFTSRWCASWKDNKEQGEHLLHYKPMHASHARCPHSFGPTSSVIGALDCHVIVWKQNGAKLAYPDAFTSWITWSVVNSTDWLWDCGPFVRLPNISGLKGIYQAWGRSCLNCALNTDCCSLSFLRYPNCSWAPEDPTTW